MSFENLLTEQKDHILYITINRESKLNALNRTTITELHAAFADAFQNPAVGGITVITGYAGQKAFVAGADISEFAAGDEATGGELARLGQATVFDLIENG